MEISTECFHHTSSHSSDESICNAGKRIKVWLVITPWMKKRRSSLFCFLEPRTGNSYLHHCWRAGNRTE